MSANPRVVAADITFTWDGVPWRLQRGQVIDVAPGSALEQAIGRDLLPPLGATVAQPAPEPAQAAQEPVEPGTQEEAGNDEVPASRPRSRTASTEAAQPASEDQAAS